MMMHSPERHQEAAFQRLARVKRSAPQVTPLLGPDMISFFKQAVAKRQAKFAKIADCWAQLVPDTLNDHCALEALNRGTLTVLVDSASHLYELKQLLLAGLERQLMIACNAAGLKKITLKPGRWYEGNPTAGRRPRFD